MRICNKCKERPTRNEKQYTCKECHNEYQKAYYKKNPQSINESSIRRKKLIRDMVVRQKDIPCMDCGISYPYYVMDFDHIKGKKNFNLSVAGSKHRALKTVQEEIDKCEVVCSNCHRERTFKRKKIIG